MFQNAYPFLFINILTMLWSKGFCSMDLVHLGTKMLLLYFPGSPSKPSGHLRPTSQGALECIGKADECLCLYFYP